MWRLIGSTFLQETAEICETTQLRYGDTGKDLSSSRQLYDTTRFIDIFYSFRHCEHCELTVNNVKKYTMTWLGGVQFFINTIASVQP